MEQINRFCNDPVLVLDDTVLQRPGRHIDGGGWLYDHNEGKTVRGMSAVTAAVSGNIYIDNWCIGRIKRKTTVIRFKIFANSTPLCVKCPDKINNLVLLYYSELSWQSS